MLEGEIVGREVVLVGDNADAKLKLLLGAESFGTGDEVGG
jgi:hypothetical protein